MPLEDNIPSETYYYHVTVQTGMKKNAGTTSTPSFILSGDEADTGVRNLIDGKRKVVDHFYDCMINVLRFLYFCWKLIMPVSWHFKIKLHCDSWSGILKEIATGSINNYILAVDKCLGPLTFLRIWHDNSGKGSKKGWFLDQVEVTDVQTGERWLFDFYNI